MAAPYLRVLVAFGVDPLDANPSNPAHWTDISDYLESDFAIKRGRNSELNQIEASTASILLRNTDRRFEIGYSSSPYYPHVVSDCAIQLIAVWNGVSYGMMRGFVQDWTPQENDLNNRVSVSITDVVGAYFSRVNLGGEVAVNGEWSNTTFGTNFAGQVGTQPGNRKVLFSIPNLPSGSFATLKIAGTNGGGVPVTENLTVTYPAVFALSTNNYRHITTVEPFAEGGDIPNGLAWTLSIDSTFPAEFSGDMMRSVLHTVRWLALSTNFSIANGISLIQSHAPNGNLLAAINAIVKAENGMIFIDRTGRFTFLNRHQRITDPIRCAFIKQPDGSTGLTEIPYENIDFDWGNQYIYNEIVLQRVGGAVITRRDTDSQKKHFLRTFKETGLLITSDAEVAASAEWKLFLYKDQKRRIRSLVLRGDLSNHWPQILQLELGHKVFVKHVPYVGGAPIEQTCVIEKIAWKGQRGIWRVTLTLSPGPIGNFLIMDDPVYGRVDYNVVAY